VGRVSFSFRQQLVEPDLRVDVAKRNVEAEPHESWPADRHKQRGWCLSPGTQIVQPLRDQLGAWKRLGEKLGRRHAAYTRGVHERQFAAKGNRDPSAAPHRYGGGFTDPAQGVGAEMTDPTNEASTVKQLQVVEIDHRGNSRSVFGPHCHFGAQPADG
jgi:hypothetical protein